MASQHPSPLLSTPEFQKWLIQKGLKISGPCCQWDYWHVLTSEGGVYPLAEEDLLSEFQASLLDRHGL